MSQANLVLPECPIAVSDVRDPHNRGRNNNRRIRPPRQSPSQNRVESRHRQRPSLVSRRSKSLNPEGPFGPRTEPRDRLPCISDEDFEWTECRTTTPPVECPKIPDPPTSSPGMRGRVVLNPSKTDNDRALIAREHPRARSPP